MNVALYGRDKEEDKQQGAKVVQSSGPVLPELKQASRLGLHETGKRRADKETKSGKGSYKVLTNVKSVGSIVVIVEEKPEHGRNLNPRKILLGVVKSFKILEGLRKNVEGAGRPEVDLIYLGGLSVLLTFPSGELAEVLSWQKTVRFGEFGLRV